jgi:hypothetical protein
LNLVSRPKHQISWYFLSVASIVARHQPFSFCNNKILYVAFSKYHHGISIVSRTLSSHLSTFDMPINSLTGVNDRRLIFPAIDNDFWRRRLFVAVVKRWPLTTNYSFLSVSTIVTKP